MKEDADESKEPTRSNNPVAEDDGPGEVSAANADEDDDI